MGFADTRIGNAALCRSGSGFILVANPTTGRINVSIEVIKPARAEVLRGLARFNEITGVSTGLPDMHLPSCQRTFYSVLGFVQPKGDEEFSPFGDAVVPKIDHLPAGYGAAFVKARPGCGVLMHAHDTSESFMPVGGQWKVEWEGAEGTSQVLLEPLDFICLPVGVQRRFECVSAPAGQSEGTLFAIISGETPVVEWSPEAVAQIAAAQV